MIWLNKLIPIANVNKTHGIHGELSVTVDSDAVIEQGSCLITPVNGIPVPFFVSSIRRRSADTFLISLDGIDSDVRAADFTGATFYADPSVISGDIEEGDEDEEEGFYASALIGSTIVDTDGREIGTVADIDDSTSNLLMIVDGTDSRQFMIPLAADLIREFNSDNSIIIMDLPEGLIDMQ